MKSVMMIAMLAGSVMFFAAGCCSSKTSCPLKDSKCDMMSTCRCGDKCKCGMGDKCKCGTDCAKACAEKNAKDCKDAMKACPTKANCPAPAAVPAPVK